MIKVNGLNELAMIIEDNSRIEKAEREAKRAYKKDLIKQGIDKELAEVMAKTFIEYQIIKPVVNI